MGGIAGSFSKQKSSGGQSSESGISGEDRALATEKSFEELENLGEKIDAFNKLGPSLLNLNSSGLTPGVSKLANDLVTSGVTQQFNKLSAGGAARGQLSPNNTPGLIASATQRAVQSALPQFISQAGENERFNALEPQKFAQQGLQQFKEMIALLQNLTEGSSSSGSQKSSGFSVGGSGQVK